MRQSRTLRKRRFDLKIPRNSVKLLTGFVLPNKDISPFNVHFHEARDENPHLELRLQTVNRQKEILGDTPIRRSVPLEIPCRTWRIFVIAVRGDEYLAVRDSRWRELGKQPHAVGSRRI